MALQRRHGSGLVLSRETMLIVEGELIVLKLSGLPRHGGGPPPAPFIMRRPDEYSEAHAQQGKVVR